LPTGFGADTNQSNSPHTSGTSYNVGWTIQGKTNGLYRIRTEADANQSGDVNYSNVAFDQNAIDVNIVRGRITQTVFSPGSEGNTYAINTNFNVDMLISCDSNQGCGNVDSNVQYCVNVAACDLDGGPWFDINSSGGPIQLVSGTMPDNNSNLSGNIRIYDANWVLKGTVANSYELRFQTYGNVEGATSITAVTSSLTAYTITISAASTDSTFALSLPSSGCTEGKGSIDAGTSCDKGYFEATDLTGTADQNEINPEGQTAGIPLFVYDNQSSTSSDLNIALDLNAALPSTLRLKAAQASNRYFGNCSGHTDSNCVQITDSNENIGKATFTSGSQDLNVWLWADFVAAAGNLREDRNVASTTFGSLACGKNGCFKEIGIMLLIFGILLILFFNSQKINSKLVQKIINLNQKGNFFEKKYFIAAIIAIIFVAGIFLVFSGSEKNNSTGLASAQGVTCLNLDRSNYNLPTAIFSELPSVPKCFESIVSALHSNKFFDETFFGKEFFSQPEFYPNFLEHGLKQWIEPDAERWNVVGFGFFSSSKNVSLKEKNKTTARIFVHSAYGIRTFQGMKIVPELADKADEEFVSVFVKEKEFVLEPSYPKFEKDWARAIDIVIEKKKEFNKGIEINLRIVSPSQENQELWKEKFGSKYYDSTQFVGEKNYTQIVVNN
ncbi:MAG: hypothetical protein Q7K42_03210, partial [Candidatus Diapherotrites archaeon]|nr:hypothetical protein [Candidatus Diapherotrites archaeon]